MFYFLRIVRINLKCDESKFPGELSGVTENYTARSSTYVRHLEQKWILVCFHKVATTRLFFWRHDEPTIYFHFLMNEIFSFANFHAPLLTWVMNVSFLLSPSWSTSYLSLLPLSYIFYFLPGTFELLLDTLLTCGTLDGWMVRSTLLESESSAPESSPGVAVFCSRITTLTTHSAFLHLGVEMGTGDFNAGGRGGAAGGNLHPIQQRVWVEIVLVVPR